MVPRCVAFDGNDIAPVLAKYQELQKDENNFNVVSSFTHSDMVGKLGVASIVDGMTPDGIPYEWSKAGRAGRMKKSDLTKIHVKDQ